MKLSQSQRHDNLMEGAVTADQLPNMFELYPGVEVLVGEYIYLGSGDARKITRYRRGKVVRTYPSYIVVAFKNYIECFQKQSIICNDVDLSLAT